MKTIKLNLDDKVYSRIKTAMMIKKMSGNLFGEIDEFIVMLITSIEKEKKEITLIPKRGKKK